MSHDQCYTILVTLYQLSIYNIEDDFKGRPEAAGENRIDVKETYRH